MLLLPKNARILGQGITGSEGSRTLPWMLKYGTIIVAGVTPGKGGQVLEGVPIFNTIRQAIDSVGRVNGSVQLVPPKFVKDATVEAIKAGIKFVLVSAEKVPTSDSAYLYALSKQEGVNIVGPSSVGLISPHRKLKIGLIGGENPNKVFADGNIAVISKSGSMTAEISLLLKNHGFGISWGIGIGGDKIIGTDFTDLLLELEKDNKTKASVIFGELGGTYEERVADTIKKGKITKPVVAFIAGEFTLTLPSEVQFGHAGAIIEGDRGRPDYKRQVLREAGVLVADDFDNIANLVRKVING